MHTLSQSYLKVAVVLTGPGGDGKYGINVAILPKSGCCSDLVCKTG